MHELRELYQSVILDHNKRPRNSRKPEGANRKAEGFNPLCGDRVKVYVRLEGDVVKDVGFEGAGCAISTASASMMTEIVKGKRREEVERLFEHFRALVAGEAQDRSELGKLEVFAGVREFPIRVKCATLVWHALNAALSESQQSVSTE